MYTANRTGNQATTVIRIFVADPDDHTFTSQVLLETCRSFIPKLSNMLEYRNSDWAMSHANHQFLQALCGAFGNAPFDAETLPDFSPAIVSERLVETASDEYTILEYAYSQGASNEKLAEMNYNFLAKLVRCFFVQVRLVATPIPAIVA